MNFRDLYKYIKPLIDIYYTKYFGEKKAFINKMIDILKTKAKQEATKSSIDKSLCFPASCDTVDSSNGQEDHVSMGANAATKLYRVLENCYTIQGIELLNAAQASEFRKPLKTSSILQSLHASYREVVPFVEEDCYLHPLISASTNFVKNISWKM